METTINDTNELGSAIRSRRKEAGLTQAKAASLAGVGTRFLSELERGKATSEIGKTLRILQLLGLELHIKARG
jgi:y4mF family transcriptional regulator